MTWSVGRKKGEKRRKKEKKEKKEKKKKKDKKEKKEKANSEIYENDWAKPVQPGSYEVRSFSVLRLEQGQ